MDIFEGIYCNNMDATCVIPLASYFPAGRKMLTDCFTFKGYLLSMFVPQVWRLKVMLGVETESSTNSQFHHT